MSLTSVPSDMAVPFVFRARYWEHRWKSHRRVELRGNKHTGARLPAHARAHTHTKLAAINLQIKIV